MGTLVTRGGGDGGRAELAQILANFFITVPKARILTPYLEAWVGSWGKPSPGRKRF